MFNERVGEQMAEGTGHDKAQEFNRQLLFKPQSWLEKIDLINHLILLENVLITLFSESEGGKTSFCQVLREQLDSQVQSCLIQPTQSLDRTTLISNLSTSFQLDSHHESIASVVSALNERRTHLLILIDDADYLASDVVEELMSAVSAQENFSFVHFCLLSNGSLNEQLESGKRKLSERYIHKMELGGLTQAETKTYTLHRALNSQLINKPLSEQQLTRFYDQTKGNLALINRSLEAFIFQCTAEKKQSVYFLNLKRAILGLLVIAITGFGYLNANQLSQFFGIPQWISGSNAEFIKDSIIDLSCAMHDLNEFFNTVSMPEENLQISYLPPIQGSLAEQAVSPSYIVSWTATHEEVSI